MSYEQLLAQMSSPWAQFLISIGAGTVIGIVLANVLNAIANRSKRPVVKDAAARVRTIAFLLCFLYGAKFGINAFTLEESTSTQLHRAFTVLIFIFITWAINHIYDSVHEKILLPWGQKKNNVTLINVGSTLAHVVLWSLGIVSGLNSAGYNVSTILAGLGIGGLAFALAAQDTVANFFGGVIVLTQNPFRVGDLIEVKGVRGWVGNIGLRSTVIDTWLGHRVTLPNKVFTDSPVTNIDARTLYWENIQLKLRHDTSMAQIRRTQEVLREIFANHQYIDDNIWVGVCNIGPGYIEIESWFGTKAWDPADTNVYPNEYGKILGVKSEVHMSLLDTLEQEGVKLASPIETHRIQQIQAEHPSRF